MEVIGPFWLDTLDIRMRRLVNMGYLSTVRSLESSDFPEGLLMDRRGFLGVVATSAVPLLFPRQSRACWRRRHRSISQYANTIVYPSTRQSFVTDLEPDEIQAGPNGWIGYKCPARGWVKWDSPYIDIDIYVGEVDWYDRYSGVRDHFTSLGEPGTVSGIIFGVDYGPNMFLTSQSSNAPDRFLPVQSNPWRFSTVVNDTYAEDNSGYFWLWIRSHV